MQICIIIPIIYSEGCSSLSALLKDIARIGVSMPMTVLVCTNNIELPTDTIALIDAYKWNKVQASQTLPELQFRRWCYNHALKISAQYYFQISPDVILQESFFKFSLNTWKQHNLRPDTILNLTGEGSLPKRKPYLPIQKATVPAHTFMTSIEGLGAVRKSPATPQIMGCMGSLMSMRPNPSTNRPKAAVGPSLASAVPNPSGNSIATFMVATHMRPEFLKLCLEQLQAQEIPPGWEMEILVCGLENDPGRKVAEAAGVTYLTSSTGTVTSKLNKMLEHAHGVLVMKADDDDLQPPDRMRAAVTAFMAGAGWSGVSTVCFYDTASDMVMQWSGQAEWGLIGTSMNYTTELLRSVGGWPDRVRGEDGVVATKIKQKNILFQDTTPLMGTILCLQHSENLYPRPVLGKDEQTSRGGFRILGLGSLQQSSIPKNIKALFESNTQKPSLKQWALKTQVHYPEGPIKIGIGVCSYERPDALQRWAKNLKNIIGQASSEFTIVPVLSVCDAIRPPLFIEGIPCIYRTNMGVAWTKNNALRYLSTQNCDYYFLVEDDCDIPDWNFFHQYVKASQAIGFHHLTYGPITEWNTWILTGNTLESNGYTFKEYRRRQEPQSTSGVITFHSRHALEVSGGLDMRFLGRGHAHKEWTERTLQLVDNKLPSSMWFLDIPENDTVTFDRGPSRGTSDTELIARNLDLLNTRTPNPCYDFLWADLEFPTVPAKKDLWAYLNSKYPVSKYTGIFNSAYDRATDIDLFHQMGQNHPQEPISICLSLKNRADMLEGLIEHLNASFEDPSLYEMVVTDFQSDDCQVLDKLKELHCAWQVVTLSGYFSRAKGLHMAALKARHNLLMFFDVDMAVTSPIYWAWIRRHAHAQAVMFPICYGLHRHSPMEVRGSSKNPYTSTGFWREDGYGMCAMTRADYLATGGWDCRIVRWGGEDNDLHWYCKNMSLDVKRIKSVYLFHRWHPETAEYKDRYGDKRQKTLQGRWKDPGCRGEGVPDPTILLKGYHD